LIVSFGKRDDGQAGWRGKQRNEGATNKAPPRMCAMALAIDATKGSVAVMMTSVATRLDSR
jgi:glycerol-3-phosphate acyltransferase PlsY